MGRMIFHYDYGRSFSDNRKTACGRTINQLVGSHTTRDINAVNCVDCIVALDTDSPAMAIETARRNGAVNPDLSDHEIDEILGGNDSIGG